MGCYPTYIFPETFLTFQDRHDFQVKAQLIRSISNIKTKKEFHINRFLAQFQVSNKIKTKIKNRLINLLKELEDRNFIKSEFLLIGKNNSIQTIQKS